MLGGCRISIRDLRRALLFELTLRVISTQRFTWYWILLIQIFALLRTCFFLVSQDIFVSSTCWVFLFFSRDTTTAIIAVTTPTTNVISLIRWKPSRFFKSISSHRVTHRVWIIIRVVRVLTFNTLFIILRATLTADTPRIVGSLLARLLIIWWAATAARVGCHEVIGWLRLGRGT